MGPLNQVERIGLSEFVAGLKFQLSKIFSRFFNCINVISEGYALMHAIMYALLNSFYRNIHKKGYEDVMH
jgi:hypothetical protein